MAGGYHSITLAYWIQSMEMQDFYLVGLGASAGGHQSLREFFENMPDQPGMSFVVTHLRRDHISILDQIISRYTRMAVVRMKGGDVIRVNHVYVMLENAQAEVKDGILVLKPRGVGDRLHKPIDIFFHSLARDRREKAVGIVFSGMGSDGFEGVQAIHENGGTVLVQDPRSTEFSSMPETIVKRDNPDVILPPAQLARELMLMLSERQSVENQ